MCVRLFYDHCAHFYIRIALSVLKRTYLKSEVTRRHTHFGSNFPTVSRQTQQGLCFSSFHFYETKHLDHSQIIFFKACRESFDITESQQHHLPGANTICSRLQLRTTKVQKSHGHIIRSRELPSV